MHDIGMKQNSAGFRTVALLWLTLLAVYSLGSVSATRGWWPYSQVRGVIAFVAGHAEESTTVWQKLLNDTGVLPLRFTVNPAPLAHPRSAYEPLEGLAFDSERDPPLVHVGVGAAQGYRLVTGAFDLQDSIHAALLLDPEGAVQKAWTISQNDLPWPHNPDHLIFPHGVEITRDGSIIVAYDAGSSLTKYDYCGRKLWQVEGGFHHSIDSFDGRSFWVWGSTVSGAIYGENLMQVSTMDGSVLREFSIIDIMEANPEIDILGVRQVDSADESAWAEDPFHPNDIDPLPEELTEFYPKFEAGDLLISLRSLNLIAVVDPADLKVKWWRQGAVRRQHDPDWNERGTITVFNNNMHRGYSGIVEIDPATMERRTLVDGAEHDFYTWHRGKQQELDDGSILVTAADQGRVFEVSADGRVTFDLHNLYSSEHGALALSEARFLPQSYFRELPSCKD